jgi:hypothetical protein
MHYASRHDSGSQAVLSLIQLSTDRFVHITNKNDPIPKVPPRLLGFHHPHNEIHIGVGNVVSLCPGQENQVRVCMRVLRKTIPDSGAELSSGT